MFTSPDQTDPAAAYGSADSSVRCNRPEPFAVQRVSGVASTRNNGFPVADEETMRLRRALDSAIYSLEQIKRRADSGATSQTADWDCLVIAEAAEAAIERIAEHCRKPKRGALHPALEHQAKYRDTAA